MALSPEYIVVHTAGLDMRNCDRDFIHALHLKNGWNGIGYHFVIVDDRHDTHPDGMVQIGRDIREPGAHVKGLNDISVGICCVGHGDLAPFTKKQIQSLITLVSDLLKRFGLSPDCVIGHREVNRLADRGIVGKEFTTPKTCPGNLVDMDHIREVLIEKNEKV